MRKPIKESRPGRFSYLLKGRARPRRSLALMMALVIVAVMSMATVVSADDYYVGDLMKTNASLSGTGDFWYHAENLWTKPDNIVSDTNSTTFTVPATAIGNVSWAHLWVVVYQGNMTANYYGNETITLDHGSTETLASAQPLVLDYNRTVGANHTNPGTPYFVDLNRVTSDYVNEFDVKSLITRQSISVTATTYNESLHLQPGYGRFDGRIKTMVLAIGYNDGDKTNDVKYWVNVGHDTVTKLSTLPYLSNTTFHGVLGYAPTATLDTVFLASLDGKYYYTNVTGGTVNSIKNQTPGVLGAYFGYDTWSIPTKNTNDITFLYDRSDSQSYYKLFLSFLKETNASVYDFSGNYAGTPGTNEWAYGNQISTNAPNGSTTLPSTSITTASGIKYLADGDVTLSQAGTFGYYAAQYLNYKVCEPKANIVNMSLTLNVSGQNTNAAKNGFDVFVWNQRTSTWDNKYSTTDSTYKYVTLDLVPASDYVDSSGNVKALIIQKGTRISSYYSYIRNDYDRLTVIDP